MKVLQLLTEADEKNLTEIFTFFKNNVPINTSAGISALEQIIKLMTQIVEVKEEKPAVEITKRKRSNKK